MIVIEHILNDWLWIEILCYEYRQLRLFHGPFGLLTIVNDFRLFFRRRATILQIKMQLIELSRLLTEQLISSKHAALGEFSETVDLSFITKYLPEHLLALWQLHRCNFKPAEGFVDDELRRIPDTISIPELMSTLLSMQRACAGDADISWVVDESAAILSLCLMKPGGIVAVLREVFLASHQQRPVDRPTMYQDLARLLALPPRGSSTAEYYKRLWPCLLSQLHSNRPEFRHDCACTIVR